LFVRLSVTREKAAQIELVLCVYTGFRRLILHCVLGGKLRH